MTSNTHYQPPPLASWVLARLLCGDIVDDDTFDMIEEPFLGLAQHLAKGNGADRKEMFAAYTQDWPNATEIARSILRTAPTDTPPEPEPGAVQMNVPELPASARLSDKALAEAGQVGQWLSTYVDYAAARSPMTPRAFHEAGGLWLGAVAIARRVYVELPHADVFPNLYIVWTASTTLFAKSTGLSIVEELARDALNHLLLPAEFTPEALLSELAGKDPHAFDDLPDDVRQLWQHRRNFAAQRGLLLEEFSGVLASAKRDYNAGLTEHLLRLHDCGRQWAKRTQGGGLVVVKYPFVNLLGATTPEALSQYLTRTAWLSGFWPRFGLLSPEVERPPFRRTEKRPERPAVLVERLSKLASHDLPVPEFPQTPVGRPAILEAEAHEGWKQYDRALRYDLLTDDLEKPLWGVYGRLPTQAMKVAAILAAFDWNGEVTPTITLGHWARAQTIVETWRASVHRLLVPAQVQEEQTFENKIAGIVRRAGPEGLTAREIGQRAHRERAEVELVIHRLTKDGLLEAFVPEGGRVQRYRSVAP